MTKCNLYNPDKVFQRFKLLEFPTSFVGLWTTQILSIDVDLSKSAYLKTFYEGRLLKFEEAREISANHRAFNILQLDNHTIQITYHPKTECVSRARRKQQLHNRFVFDLRLIKVDGERCCYDESHAEIGRYFISGEYDFSQITHSPKVVDFGDAVINKKKTCYIRIINESKVMAADVEYERLICFDVMPAKFVLPPNSTKRLTISITPGALKVPTTFLLKIRNPKCEFNDKLDKPAEEGNFIPYIINAKINITYNKKPKMAEIESTHILYEQLPEYTYIDKELEIYNQRKTLAMNLLEASKGPQKRANMLKKAKEQFTTGNIRCYSNTSVKVKQSGEDLCKIVEHKVSTYDLFNIQFLPNLIDFSKVGISTYGKRKLTIKNGTKYNVNVRLCRDTYITYTENKLASILIKLEPLTQCKILICCNGLNEGNHKGTFEYIIDDKYKLKHMYSLQVEQPRLLIMDTSLKFGMVTTDTFITSVPLRIYNEFNTTVEFNWGEIHPEIPFEIMPMSGMVPGQSCKICDVWHISKPTKTKTHEIDFYSKCFDTTVTPIELSIITRKLSIKFLQPVVVFEEIPLNLEIVKKVKLENSSREMAVFQVIEPLIPGLRMEPMHGIIRPKMIMSIDIIVKIPYVLEFSFDIYVKINNKEIVVLSISGIVVEPKINIQPKNIYMPRVPCHMITYVPVMFQNMSTLKTEVEVLDTGDDNIFDVYMAQGNDKQRVFFFTVEGGQSKVVYIKVCDIFRREYEMYIPFKINGLLGPPINNLSSSTEITYYLGAYEHMYENNPKVKLKTLNKDISYCRIIGVITVPWITLSTDDFQFEYVPLVKNTKTFTITNISKYYLNVTIITIKLFPNFTLTTNSVDYYKAITNESLIKFDLRQGEDIELLVTFNPKHQGKFVATATLYLDKAMSIPYSNLTFYGKRVTPMMRPSTYRVIFPPCHVRTINKQFLTLDFEAESDIESFSCYLKDKRHLSLQFVDIKCEEDNHDIHTIVTVELIMSSDLPRTGSLTLHFTHDSQSGCDVEVRYCVTYCPLTLHATSFTDAENNPYPFYPLSSQTELYEYLEVCCGFLEKWMFLQGFRRDLCPIIPDTFHATSTAMSSTVKSGKGIYVSYLNFVRRIAGPLMKHVRKVSVQEVDELFKSVQEIYETYAGIILLLQSRGANLFIIDPKYLLSYEQFLIHEEHVTPTTNADIILSKELIADVDLFNRLNKQCWIDFILQSYKVFVMDSCFFECVCVSNQPRDIIKILIDWYNVQIAAQHNILRGKQLPVKVITNLTTDLTDGIALASVITSYCPFLMQQFSIFCEIQEETEEGDIVNNACLIIEAMNQLRLYFPLCSKDFFEPNFLQMLFLSIHLYVVLPMFKPKDTIVLNPPLLRTSNRFVSICPSSQETLIFSFMILNNYRNSFLVEKITSPENGKKMFLSVKYVANFVDDEKCLLLVHGYNKTRIFDTYILFVLHGQISALNPERKCKVTAPLYRPNKVDIIISSPFATTAVFKIHITDVEPTTPVHFDETSDKPQFFLRRLNLIDREINLNGLPKDSAPIQESVDQKLYLLLICLSTQTGNSWIWFRSEVGHFFVRVTTQPRWDLAIDTLNATVHTWPMDPCSCGESCECYRTTMVTVPHCNELMLKGLRSALVENASPTMMNIFDQLVDSMTGRLVLAMLLREGGTNMSELYHLLQNETTYIVSSKTLMSRLEKVTFSIHSNSYMTLPITLLNNGTIDKYMLTFTSECGMDIRTYRIVFINSLDKVSGP